LTGKIGREREIGPVFRRFDRYREGERDLTGNREGERDWTGIKEGREREREREREI
jgi:hypothetical protein